MTTWHNLASEGALAHVPKHLTIECRPKWCGQEAVIDRAPYADHEHERRYENALKWITLIAGSHYWGGAFEPEHMRSIANIAADALAGKDLPDHDEAMEKARVHAGELAGRLGLNFTGAGGHGEEEDSE